MEKVILKAKEGGFHIREKHVDVGISQLDTHYCYEAIREDPEFWRCLGKVEGWGETDLWLSSLPRPSGEAIPYWKLNWHLFIDCLAEGKDIDSFFNELLN